MILVKDVLWLVSSVFVLTSSATAMAKSHIKKSILVYLFAGVFQAFCYGSVLVLVFLWALVVLVAIGASVLVYGLSCGLTMALALEVSRCSSYSV